MSSRNKRRKENHAFRSVMLVIVIACIVIFVFFAVSSTVGKKGDQADGQTGDQTESQMTESQVPVASETEEKDIFPYMLEDGKLEVLSLSVASVPNPDAGGVMGEDTACLEVKNVSGEYIEQVSISAVLEDDVCFHFEIHDLPAEGTVQAFDIDNAVYDGETACVLVEAANLQILDEVTGIADLSDQIECTIENTTIQLTNISDGAVGALELVCLCDFDGTYYGGTSYRYTVEGISAGESVSVEAADCYLGQAAIVRVIMDN